MAAGVGEYEDDGDARRAWEEIPAEADEKRERDETKRRARGTNGKHGRREGRRRMG